MSEIVDGAVKALNARLSGEGLEAPVKLVIEDEGAIVIGENGAAAGDGEADCTMTASAETFESLLAGELDPTTAFMSGKLSVEGDMSLAMKLASLIG